MSINSTEKAVRELVYGEELVARNENEDATVRYYYDDGIWANPEPNSQTGSPTLPQKCQDNDWIVKVI
jgi:hypothetical protein